MNMKTTHLLQAFYLVLLLSSLLEAQLVNEEDVKWSFLYDFDYIWFQDLDLENTIEDCFEEGLASSLEKTSKLCKTSPEEFVEEVKEEAEDKCVLCKCQKYVICKLTKCQQIKGGSK